MKFSSSFAAVFSANKTKHISPDDLFLAYPVALSGCRKLIIKRGCD